MTDLDVILDVVRSKLNDDIDIETGMSNRIFNVRRIYFNRLYLPFGIIVFEGDKLFFIPAFGSYKVMCLVLSDPDSSLNDISDYINSVGVEHAKLDVDRVGVTWECVTAQK